MAIAYTFQVYENTKEVWEEDLQIKVKSKNDLERCYAMRHKKTKYHEGRGKHLKRFCNGWTDNVQECYQELVGIFKNLKSSDVWETLQEHWKLYQKKHYARGDNQDDDLRTPEEECAASDKDNWQRDIPDEDEIHEIEEASVDDDSQCPRTRPKFSCGTGIVRRCWGLYLLCEKV